MEAQERADVIIIGVGAMGSAAADRLALQGKKVLGFEQFTIAHDQGSSHGGSRIIRQSYFEHPDYVPLLKRAYELYAELDEYQRSAGGEGLFFQTGGLYFGPEASVTFSGSRMASEMHHLPFEILDAEQIKQCFPQLTPAPTDVGVFEEMAGYVVPESTVAIQVERARSNGADIRENEKVLGYDSLADGGVKVTTASGDYYADTLVITAGAWATRLLEDLHIPMVVERQVMHWFDVGEAYEDYAAGPVYIHETENFEQIYGFPAIDGPQGGGKVAFFRAGWPSDPDALDRVVTPAEVAVLQERLSRTLPQLGAGAPINARACMYTTTPDEHFVIGRDPRPGNRDIIIACGFSGHGFKFVPVIGELIANMAVTGVQTCGIPLFDPLRFSEVKNAVDLL